MTEVKKTTSFVAACRQFFGYKPGQKLSEFMDEVKQLTDKDRAEMAPQLSVALGEPVSV